LFWYIDVYSEILCFVFDLSWFVIGFKVQKFAHGGVIIPFMSIEAYGFDGSCFVVLMICGFKKHMMYSFPMIV